MVEGADGAQIEEFQLMTSWLTVQYANHYANGRLELKFYLKIAILWTTPVISMI